MPSRFQDRTDRRRPRRPPIEDLRHRAAALRRHHAHLEARLRDALSAPAPDAGRVEWIKAEALKVEDEIARLAAEVHRRVRPRRSRGGGVAPPAVAAAE
jgi:hypothetical protein